MGKNMSHFSSFKFHNRGHTNLRGERIGGLDCCVLKAGCLEHAHDAFSCMTIVLKHIYDQQIEYVQMFALK